MVSPFFKYITHTVLNKVVNVEPFSHSANNLWVGAPEFLSTLDQNVAWENRIEEFLKDDVSPIPYTAYACTDVDSKEDAAKKRMAQKLAGLGFE